MSRSPGEPYERDQPVAPRKGQATVFVDMTRGQGELRGKARLERLTSLIEDPSALTRLAASLTITGRARGSIGEIPADQLGRADLYELEPVRRPPSHPKMRNFIALHPSSRGPHPHHLWAESFLEVAHLREIDFEGETAELATQAVFFRWRNDDAVVRHFPDFLLRSSSGELTVVDVTLSKNLTKPEFRIIATTTARTCDLMGWRYQIGVELAPQRIVNLAYLEGFQATPTGIACAALTAPQPAPPTLGSLINRLGGGRDGTTLALHVLWERRYGFALAAPLSEITPLTAEWGQADNAPARHNAWDLL